MSKSVTSLQVKVLGLAALSLATLGSCKKQYSNSTGWTINDPKNGGFEVVDFGEQETGAGLVLIEGGSFSMGRVEQEVNYDWNNQPRRVSVSSFYMDETEVTNVSYREYLYWTRRVYGADYPEVYKKALPDTLVWRDVLAYNEPLVENYLRHPAYNDYPVVGVNWLQSNDYCAWRSDRNNERILIREGVLRTNPNQVNEDNFNTDAYLVGQYEGMVKNNPRDLDPNNDRRTVRWEDGVMLPRYRLPTEAEWEFAAYGLIGNSLEERVSDRRLYPWNGHFVRDPREKYRGAMLGNFKRGRGDNMGVAGSLNDAGDYAVPVYSYIPNDYGLYNMAGNVSEWVMDVYRPLSHEDKTDMNPYRGNVFKTQQRDEEGAVAEKDSLGHITYRGVTDEEAANRRNYKKSDNIGSLDVIDGGDESQTTYQYGVSTLISDKAHVYKGASWKDRAYYLSPGTRRFLEEDQATAWLGFRCAMARVGDPQSEYTKKMREKNRKADPKKSRFRKE